ncbi:uncharacterized protein DNG_01924 [Cephalotrichum gorgonifer]|uniref:Uncharacterized protein n=1 Tax=Cephalotrichum gorgonifer TaxID=2041049 RepID=A0AAE8MU09_9PEZI|nr:uncharacterized protein DNG_01924 [Cephalotrichum gorgonifer]
MPHKHTRKATDAKDYDLPPTKIARPLPVVSNKKRAEGAKTEYVASRGGKRKRGRDNDDTPRAFKRLMAFTPGQKISGLDDGVDKKSKAKKQKETTKPEEENIPVPSIRPGESLSDFAARVDATIPVAGLINKTARGGKDPLGLKVYRTRKEKKMHKLYDQWRAEERKIQEQKEEQYEEAAARELEDGWTGADGTKGANEWDLPPKEEGKKNKKKKKQKRGGKGAKDKEEDPWEELRRKRGEGKVKFGEVANAPPSLQKVAAKLPTHE